MPANETTRIQVNFKSPSGTLVNVYAENQADLSELLGEIETVAPQIAALEGVLGAVAAAASISAPPSQQRPAEVAPGPGNGPPSATPSCAHGPRRFKSGTNKFGKPYKAWFCPSIDRNNQCAAVWED